MVLVVPDEPEETPGEEQEEGPRPKAQLDDSEASRAARKVDLDLDDAPFLEDEEEEEEAVAEPVEASKPLDTPKPKKERKPLPPWVKNKFTIIGAGAAVLLIGLALFLFTGGEPEPQAPPPEETPEPPPEPEIPAEVQQDHLVRLDPFIIEQTDEAGDVRFLEVRLIFTTPEGPLADNLVRNTPTVRYALFYYLKNKDLTFLTDETNSEALKQELLAVVNQYMADGRFENLLFEQYLVK